MTRVGVEVKVVKIPKPEDVNFYSRPIPFIKTIEDIAEAVVGSVPGAKFCLAFSGAPGECPIRIDGTRTGQCEGHRGRALVYPFFSGLLPPQCPEPD